MVAGHIDPSIDACKPGQTLKLSTAGYCNTSQEAFTFYDTGILRAIVETKYYSCYHCKVGLGAVASLVSMIF